LNISLQGGIMFASDKPLRNILDKKATKM